MAKKDLQSQTVPLGKRCEISHLVEIKDIRQISGSFNQSPDAFVTPKNIDIQRKAEVQIDNESNMLFVVVDFELNAASAEDKDKEVLKISASFLAVYKLENMLNFTNKDFEVFANKNGIYNVWPFWREYVQSCSVRMGLPAITIPVFRIWG